MEKSRCQDAEYARASIGPCAMETPMGAPHQGSAWQPGPVPVPWPCCDTAGAGLDRPGGLPWGPAL